MKEEKSDVESTNLLLELDSTFKLFEQVSLKEKERFKGTEFDGPFNLILGCCREARKKISFANIKSQIHNDEK